jgi:hypothetical protein
MSFKDLPTELKFRLFQFLSLQDLIRVSLVCKEFLTISNIESLWQKIFYNESNHRNENILSVANETE